MKYLDSLIERKTYLQPLKDSIEEATNEIIKCFRADKKLLVCGNGGSSCDSAHITGELMKSFVKKRHLDNELIKKLQDVCEDKNYYDLYVNKLEQGLPCIDLTAFSGLNTAFMNDTEGELLFANSVLGLGKKGDILLAITTSGNSKNILHAINVAKAKNIKTIALTGKGGGEIKKLADINIISPQKETYLVQEDHISIYHSMCLDIENIIF